MAVKEFNVDIDLNGNKIVNVADPSAGTDAVNLNYVVNYVNGRQYKEPVRAASTANVTLSAPGASIDGVTLTSGDRVLLKNQTTGSQNGIYVWNGSAVAMTRAADADTSAEVKPGLTMMVTEGSTNADKEFMLTTDGTITLDTTVLTFTQVNAGGTSYSAGNGLSLTSTTFAVVPKASGGLSVDSGGVFLASTVAGNGLTLTSGVLAVVGDSTMTVAADQIGVDTSNVARWRSATAGNGSATTLTLTHNLGNRNVLAQAIDATTYEEIECKIVRATTNTVTFEFNTAPTVNSVVLIAVG